MGRMWDDSLGELTPAELWGRLDGSTRRDAAEAMFDERSSRREADGAIADALRFRIVSVRKLPIERRVDYLLKAVRPDDNFASSLLMALHVQRRQPLLVTFLDALGIEHDGGVIDADDEFGPTDPDRIGSAVELLYAEHPDEQVEVYLATLIALDPDNWSGLADVLRARADG